MKEIIIIKILLLFICISNSFNIIKINFERFYKNNQELNITNLFENTYFYYIYTYMEIGTPSVKIPLLITDKESVINILSSNYSNNITYNLNKSLTYKLNKNYTYDSKGNYISSRESNENFIINNKQINLNFLVKNNTSDLFLKGTLGLSSFFNSKNKDLINYSLINQLKKQEIINTYDYSINFNNKNDILSKGEIIIGDLPHNYNKNYKEKDYHFVNAKYYNGPYYSSIRINEINYNYDLKKKDKIIYLEDDDEIELDINISYIFGTANFFNIIYDEFFKEYINNNKCIEYKIQRSLTSYYCDEDINLKKMKNLYFQIKNENIYFILTPKDLFYKFENKLYYLIIFHPYNSNKWILGIPFFTKYLINFNQDKKIIGFYVNDKIKDEKNYSIFLKLFIISILVNVIILIICLYYKIVKKNKKIRANELEENFDYSPYK